MTVLENVMVGCHTQSHCGTVQAILRTSRSLSEERAIRDRSLDFWRDLVCPNALTSRPQA